ncbi:solute carrier family 25 member 16 isoform X2 [Anser cygnoides]|uniref:solute carrier family 25 member 16 isoform X2 n=1 Tax=Anser cygnoides TaxID=8845 RepID=UPI0034D188A9
MATNTMLVLIALIPRKITFSLQRLPPFLMHFETRAWTRSRTRSHSRRRTLFKCSLCGGLEAPAQRRMGRGLHPARPASLLLSSAVLLSGGTRPALTPSACAAARPGGRGPARWRPRGAGGSGSSPAPQRRLLRAEPSRPPEPSRRRPCPRCPMASPAAAGPGAALPAGAGAGAARRDFYWLRSFIAGGVAGCCAKTTTAPLDRVKILLQAHNHHYKHLGVFSTLCAVPRKEGYLGLYKGNGAMMIRIFPYGAIQFMAFDQYKKVIKKHLGISGHVHRLMAGSMAGITAVICTYPLDMVRVRLAFQVKGEHKYMGIIHAFKMIYTKEGGFSGFYRGLMPTVVGMAPYAGFSFFTFGTLKSIGLAQAPNLLGRPSLDNPDVLVLKTHVNLLCGGIAGAIAQTISYPLDVTRRRMQLGAVLPDSDKCL